MPAFNSRDLDLNSDGHKIEYIINVNGYTGL